VRLTGVPRTAAGTLWTDTITWTSQDTSIASVDPNTGLVTAKAPGTTRIVAASTSRPGRTGYAQFTRIPPDRTHALPLAAPAPRGHLSLHTLTSLPPAP
jgi:hypothetical protein